MKLVRTACCSSLHVGFGFIDSALDILKKVIEKWAPVDQSKTLTKMVMCDVMMYDV